MRKGIKKMEKIVFDLDLVIDSLRDLGKEFNKAVYDLECVLDYLIEKSGEKL